MRPFGRLCGAGHSTRIAGAHCGEGLAVPRGTCRNCPRVLRSWEKRRWADGGRWLIALQATGGDQASDAGSGANDKTEPAESKPGEEPQEGALEDEDKVGFSVVGARGDEDDAQGSGAEERVGQTNDLQTETAPSGTQGTDDAGERDRPERMPKPKGVTEGNGDTKFQYPERPQHEYQLSELLNFAGYEDLSEQVRESYGDYKVKGLQNDASKVVAGDIFFCEVHQDQDDLEPAVRAVEKGAVAVVVQSDEQGVLCCEDMPLIYVKDIHDCEARLAVVFYRNPSGRMLMVGVTGSSGKSTVCWLTRAVLEHCGLMTGLMSDNEYAITDDLLDEEGDLWNEPHPHPAKERSCSTPFHLTPYKGRYTVPDTLPDTLKVQKVLAGMFERGAQACVMECPSIALDQHRCHYVYYALAVFTNLTPEHLDYHGSLDDYIEAKGLLFQKLDNPEKQRAVVNIDSEYAAKFLEFAANVPVVTYGIKDQNADVCIESVKYSIWETELLIRTPVGRMEVISYLIGEHNVYNVLAAVAVALSVNAPLEKIAAGLESVENVPGRTQVVDTGSQQLFSVVVDNAHTPQALTRLLDNIRMCGPRRILVVFGCTGDTDKELRAEMGAAAHNKADVVIITNDSPGHEHPADVVADIVAGFPEEVRDRYSLWVHTPWQDPSRTPWWFEQWLYQAQRENRRYIIEDRFFAIRTAIGTAQEGDVVVIVGKGDVDVQEFADGKGGIETGWFDDRMEAADALGKLGYLLSAGLDRKEIPWQKAKAEA